MSPNLDQCQGGLWDEGSNLRAVVDLDTGAGDDDAPELQHDLSYIVCAECGCFPVQMCRP